MFLTGRNLAAKMAPLQGVHRGFESLRPDNSHQRHGEVALHLAWNQEQAGSIPGSLTNFHLWRKRYARLAEDQEEQVRFL